MSLLPSRSALAENWARLARARWVFNSKGSLDLRLFGWLNERFTAAVFLIRLGCGGLDKYLSSKSIDTLGCLKVSFALHIQGQSFGHDLRGAFSGL